MGSTPRRPVEIELERWRIDEQGFTEAPFIARFELIWPRPGIESVKKALPLPDTIGETVDWSDGDLIKKWLFKEDMEGRMILAASVVPFRPDGDTPGVREEGVDLIGQSVARESSVSWRTLSDMIELGSGVASYVLSGPQKAIADGHVLIEQQKSQTLKFPLQAPNALENPQPDPTPEDHRPRDDHQPVLKEKGEENGFMEVSIDVWED